MAEVSEDMVYPHGYYAGHEVREMPSDYLRWMVRKWDTAGGLYGRLADSARRVLIGRHQLAADRAA